MSNMSTRGAAVSLFSSFFLVALATTLVLPKRQTPAVITAFFNGLASATKAVIGPTS